MGCPRNGERVLKAKADFLYWSERDAIRKVVLNRDPAICVWCHEPVGDHKSDNYFTVDHVVPRAHGGRCHADNLVIACRACNKDRGDMSVLGYMTYRAANDDEAE